MGCESPQEIIDLSYRYGTKTCCAEVSSNTNMICAFFDYDNKNTHLDHSSVASLKENLRSTISEIIPDCTI